MAKPRASLDELSIPKPAAAAVVPFAEPVRTDPMPAQAGPGKSLTVKLTSDDYWALRDFCTQRERTTGKRLTHQEAMVMALHCLLRQEKAA
jgi:hypothetical protein